MLTATVSGSFHRHLDAITAAVHELAALRVRVLSPADPRVVAQQGEFLFVASDPVSSVRLVQQRHLDCIRAANFVWLVCPDGYVGQSASMEIGYAAAFKVPIFATQAPSDLTLRQYVKTVPTLAAAVTTTSELPRATLSESILINPHESAEQAHRSLDLIENALTNPVGFGEPAEVVQIEVRKLLAKLALPTYAH